MKRQKSCGPLWDKLVHQLPKSINFAYDICLGCIIDHLKGISKEYTIYHHTMSKSFIMTVVGPENVV
jgi:hypothetical protein